VIPAPLKIRGVNLIVVEICMDSGHVLLSLFCACHMCDGMTNPQDSIIQVGPYRLVVIHLRLNLIDYVFRFYYC
jgi:hypothetical protein